MSDDEWAVFERFLASPSKQGGRPPKNHRRVLDGVFWIARTGAPWRDLPTEFGNWNSVSRQFRRWCKSGVWDVILQSFADSGGEQDLLQMIDSTVIRAHRSAAGIKGGLKTKPSGGHVVAFPPKSTSAPTPQVCRSPSS
jgi:transposase